MHGRSVQHLAQGECGDARVEGAQDPDQRFAPPLSLRLDLCSEPLFLVARTGPAVESLALDLKRKLDIGQGRQNVLKLAREGILIVAVKVESMGSRHHCLPR